MEAKFTQFLPACSEAERKLSYLLPSASQGRDTPVCFLPGEPLVNIGTDLKLVTVV